MDEHDIRNLIESVKSGRMSRRRFIEMMVGAGLTRAAGRPDAPARGRRERAAGLDLQAHQARRRRPGEAADVAGPDAPQSAFRRRHQGPVRLARVLRAARRLGRRRQPRADPRGRGADAAERRPGGRRHVGHLEAEAQRHSGTTAGPSPPTTSSSTGNTPPIRPPPAPRSAATRTSRCEKIDSHTVRVALREAHAVLGRSLRRA